MRSILLYARKIQSCRQVLTYEFEFLFSLLYSPPLTQKLSENLLFFPPLCCDSLSRYVTMKLLKLALLRFISKTSNHLCLALSCPTCLTTSSLRIFLGNKQKHSTPPGAASVTYTGLLVIRKGCILASSREQMIA